MNDCEGYTWDERREDGWCICGEHARLHEPSKRKDTAKVPLQLISESCFLLEHSFCFGVKCICDCHPSQLEATVADIESFLSSHRGFLTKDG